jgi:hypothetical protein
MPDNHRDTHIIEYNAVKQPDGSWLHDDGDEYWYNEEGEIHREDGPAVIRAMPYDELDWRLNCRLYSFNEWLKLTPITDEEKMLLKLRYA